MNTDLIEEIILNIYMTSTLNQQNCQLMNSQKKLAIKNCITNTNSSKNYDTEENNEIFKYFRK